MTRYRYYTATTVDGFLADDADGLDWLFDQELDESGPFNIAEFMEEIGAIVMGATTYEWIVEHELEQGRPWPYSLPTFVFTHRALPAAADALTFLAGEPAEHAAALERAAAGKDVWIVGGGGLAAEFAGAGMLSEITVSIAPVTLGSGRPLFTRAFDLSLLETVRNGDFVVARYVVGAARAHSS